jgi:hypothetical protein
MRCAYYDEDPIGKGLVRGPGAVQNPTFPCQQLVGDLIGKGLEHEPG